MRFRVEVIPGWRFWMPPGVYTPEAFADELSERSGLSVTVIPEPHWESSPGRRYWWICGVVIGALALFLVALLVTSCAHAPGLSSPALASASSPAPGAVTQDRHHGGNGR